MNRRKGVPCGCDADPCGCSPKAHCIKAINNVSPDPNGDLNIKAGAGIAISQTGDDEITITNAATPSAFVEGTNIEFTPSGDDVAINVVDDPVFSGDVTVNGETVLNDDLTVNGDIIQNGAAYETHAEKIYSQNDYIVMRDGAVSALPSGDFSGFQVKKYDGTNDGRLVIDNAGVARVGDVGDEQPLMTRSESGSLTNGNLLQWNGTTQKAVDAGVNTSQIVRGSGNIGSDTKPIKVVNGVATAITDELQIKLTVETRDIKSRLTAAGVSVTAATLYKWGNIGIISVSNMSVSTSYVNISVLNTGETTINTGAGVKMFNVNSATYIGEMYMNNGLLNIEKYGSSGTFYGSFFFMFA